jgi:hypothetical protein
MRRLGLLFALFFAACSERNFPDPVSMGVARLTVRNLGTLATLIDRDARCGFSAESVKSQPRIDGEPGRLGSVTWTTANCELDLGAPESPTLASEDCVGTQTFAAGRARLNGTKTITGTLTGNPSNPVIPLGPDAVKIALAAEVDNLIVQPASKTPALTLVSGKVSWTVQPRLGVSSSLGVCSVPTLDVTVGDIAYENARVHVNRGDRAFDVDVPTSLFWAQVGEREGVKNHLEGNITVWESAVKLPAGGDKDGLDPTYKADKHLATFSCRNDLAAPVSYACRPVAEKLSQGAAQLFVKAFANLVALADKDTACGFSSPAVGARPQISGGQGARDGVATWTLEKPCTIKAVETRRIRTDCHGASMEMRGAVSITGIKRVRGLLSGDPLQPAIPLTRGSVEFELNVSFDGFQFSDTSSPQTFVVQSGSLSGKMVPRLGLDRTTGACSIPTSVAQFQIKVKDAQVKIESGGNSLATTVNSAELEAQTGRGDVRTNYLGGKITTDGEPREIPASGEPRLDPAFDLAHFDASYLCTPNLVIPPSDAECNFTRPLAEGAARLLVFNTGVLANQINSDGGCGFENLFVKTNPEAQGDIGKPGLLRWSVQGCKLSASQPKSVDKNCLGGERFRVGDATVAARRTVTGERTRELLFFNGIKPRTRDAVTISLDRVDVQGFSAYLVPPNANSPAARLTLDEGVLSAVVKPMMGARKDEPDHFNVATPVASITDLAFSGKATLRSGPKSFALDLRNVRLSAFNGSYGGNTNFLSGSVQVGNELVQFNGIPLDPAYDQQAFDAAYACTPDLKEVIPAQPL